MSNYVAAAQRLLHNTATDSFLPAPARPSPSLISRCWRPLALTALAHSHLASLSSSSSASHAFYGALYALLIAREIRAAIASKPASFKDPHKSRARRGQLHDVELQVGLSRRALFYVPAPSPAAAQARGKPLVIALHGSMEDAEIFRLFSTDGKLDDLAERAGAIVCYPFGLGSHWNGGRVHTHTQARLANVDDVSFMRALISHAASSYGADPHAVFVTGQSNGGHMALRLFYELGCPPLRAVASVSSLLVPSSQSLVERDAAHASPPVLMLNGDQDTIVPAKGGPGAILSLFGGKIAFGKRGDYLSASDSARQLAQRLGSAADDDNNADADGRTVRDDAYLRQVDYEKDGKTLVRQMLLRGRGHVLIDKSIPGERTDVAEAIFDFFHECAPDLMPSVTK